MNDVACSENQFEQAVQHFIGSATSKKILQCSKETQKPQDMESRKWIDKIHELLETRTLADP